MPATPLREPAGESATLTAAPYQPVEQTSRLQAIEDVGGSVSGAGFEIVTSCEFVASTFPALSQARYLTVVVADTVIGSLYAVLEEVGSEPSRVYRMTLTPLSPSFADSVTVTSAAYAALEHA